GPFAAVTCRRGARDNGSFGFGSFVDFDRDHRGVAREAGEGRRRVLRRRWRLAQGDRGGRRFHDERHGDALARRVSERAWLGGLRGVFPAREGGARFVGGPFAAVTGRRGA